MKRLTANLAIALCAVASVSHINAVMAVPAGITVPSAAPCTGIDAGRFSLACQVPSGPNATADNDNPVRADSLIEFAVRYIGTPYGYGGTTERYFDCSGFTGFVFNRFGIAIPRTSRDQYTSGESVTEGEWMPGDLVFFGGRAQSSSVNHVGIVVGTLDNGSFDFIHASTSKGVIVSNSAEKYYAARYIGARRLFEPYQSRDVWELLTERFSINIERGEELHAIDGIIKPYQPSSKQEIKRLTKLKRRYSSRK